MMSLGVDNVEPCVVGTGGVSVYVYTCMCSGERRDGNVVGSVVGEFRELGVVNKWADSMAEIVRGRDVKEERGQY